METNESFKTLSATLTQEAAVKKVYGEPFEANGKTILPVAKIVMGMGTGIGKKIRSDATKDELKNTDGNTGSGSGGGAIATPLGVFEITEKQTKYISANATKYFLGGCILGSVMAGLYFRRKQYKKEN